jgi:hypothetical protein
MKRQTKRNILAVSAILPIMVFMALAVFLVTCKSLPDLSGAEPGVRMTRGEFLVELTDGNEGRGITLLGWEADKKRVRIPEKIDKVPVTAIAKGAFADKALLQEVVIPVSVREISPDAFEGSEAIQKITAHKKNPRFLSISGILYDRDSLDKIYYPAAKYDFDYMLRKESKDGGPETYTLTVSGYKGDKARLDIPDKAEGYPVTGIGDRAFAGLDFLKRVKLPRYLETMGEDVFEKCLQLEHFSLSFRNAHYEISERDLYDKRTGKLVWYPEAQAYFKYETVSMEGVSYIIITGTGTEKKKAAIPPKLNGIRVSEIASGAFEHNPALIEIVMPDSIFKMGVRTFAFCPKLSKVTLGNNLGTIPLRAFYECTALKEIVIPDSVTTIFDNAFSDCTALESVMLGRRLTALENSAFSGCSALTEIFIPERLSAIGENVFAGCRTLVNIYVDEKNETYTDIDGVLFNKAKTAILRFPEGRPGKQYTIPDSVEQIGSAAFSFCQRLSTIDLPEKATVIGNYAFFYCTALYNIRLSEIVAIGNDAFSGCASLDKINFPESLLSIGERAFAACRMLQTVNISSNVVSIGENAFRYCERLTQASLSRKTEVSSTAFAGTRAVITYID